MTSLLGREGRARLLSEAQALARQTEPRVLRQAAVALSILRQQGPEALRKALDPSVSLSVEAVARYWSEFQAKVGPKVVTLLQGDPRAAAYFLGWLKRLGMISSETEERPSRQRWGPRRG